MHAFYFNIPWIINAEEYNCSSRSHEEWKAQGSVNPKQGVYFLSTGIIYLSVYTLSLIGIFRGKLLHIPCYRLMFFNGFLDMMDIIAGSLTVSYLHFTGGVFCSNEPLTWFLGHMIWSLWMGSSVICVALATNRIVEMIPSMNKYRFFFEGRNVYIWMITSVGVCIVRPFVSRPMLYNTSVAGLLFAPVTTDNLNSELDYYTSLLFPIHNILFPTVLTLLYSVLCIYVFKMRRSTNGKIDKTQLQLFFQSLAICATEVVGCAFYIAAEFLSAPVCVNLISNMLWQLCHGIHGFVYMILNKQIRREALKLFGLKERVGTISSAALSPIAKGETIASGEK